MRRLLGHPTPASAAAARYARAPVDGSRTPWRRAHFCVVDLELSGLDPHRDEIISFAGVPIDAGRVVAGHAVHGLCRPTRPLAEESVLVHGIRTVDLEGAAPLDEAIEPLIALMTGRVLVAHAAWVESSFLAPVLRRQGVRLRQPLLDTLEMARWLGLERGQPLTSNSLSELARGLGLPVHRPHQALGDALTTAQVFLAVAAHLDRYTPQTVRSLALAHHRARTHGVYPAASEG